MPVSRQLPIIIAAVSSLFADGFIISSSTYLTPLSVKYHEVACTIDNGVATTTVDQEFVNNQADEFANGRYIFPIPRGAAIDRFGIVIDGDAKTATALSKDTARAFFYAAVKNSNQAALLEYVDNGAYTVEIGSLPPGTSRHVRISYVEVLPKYNNLVRYLYPLNTERFSMQLIDTVSIDVSIKSASPVTSVYAPSYSVTMERPNELEATVRYACSKSRPDRDFDLYYKLSDDAVSFHLFPFRKSGEDGYFLMLMTPKFTEPDPEEITVAKDIIFTIDHSGSMSGTKMVQARDALRYCLKRVLPGDFFNIVAFDQAIVSNAPGMLPVNADNVQQALSFVETVNAAGSTDIALALTATLSRIGESDRPHYCIFLTDGMPTSGVTDAAQICSLVNEANRNGTRIFSVGFGYDVNTVLIDKLSMDNGGYPLYCSPDQNIETVVGDLYRRIESPVLTSPQLDIGGAVATWGISPAHLPDLFSGSEIAVFGRYKEQGRSGVTLTGIAGGAADTMRYEAEFPDTATLYPFIPRLWATQQIAALMTRIKLQSLTQENLAPLVDSVKALSLAYGIVTPYTSSLFVPGGSATSWAGSLQAADGRSANDASNFMQGMQQNANAAQTVVADTNSLPVNVAPRLNQMQNVGNKIFVFTTDSIWKDAAYDSTVPADTVYYGSDEYFTLAGPDPDLRKMLTVGNQAAFNYDGRNYLVLDVGAAAVKPHLSAITAHSGVNIVIRQSGKAVRFIRPMGDGTGTVEILTINGSRVARLNFGTSETTVAWTATAARGAYCAVYRSNGMQMARKFVVR